MFIYSVLKINTYFNKKIYKTIIMSFNISMGSFLWNVRYLSWSVFLFYNLFSYLDNVSGISNIIFLISLHKSVICYTIPSYNYSDKTGSTVQCPVNILIVKTHQHQAQSDHGILSRFFRTWGFPGYIVLCDIVLCILTRPVLQSVVKSPK